MSERPFIASAWAVILAISFLAPLAVQARYQPKPAWNMFSRQRDIEIGKDAAATTDKQLPLLKDSDPITHYIRRLGQELAAHAPEPAYPYTFKVVSQKEINAFALPGGPIYINLGTIQAADKEAQVVGVLAHEMGHVIMRHGTAAASKQIVAQVPLQILGGMMAPGVGADLARFGISFGVGSYFLKNSRAAEAQADLVGTNLMYDTGYDPRALPEFFLKLEKEGGARGPQFLSDHPNPGNRAEAVSREVSTLPPKQYLPESLEFRDIKRQAAGMKAMSAQQIAEWQKQQGGTVGEVSPAEVMPSGNFKSLDHSAFRISYPDNWDVLGDESSAVTIAPRAGMSENAVAYGVIINGYQPEGGQAASLDDATHQLIQSLRQSNPDLRVIGHDEDIRVAGTRGKSVDLIGSSPIHEPNGKPLRERDWLITLKRNDGTLVYLIFISADRDFNHLAPTFEKMQQSFQLR